MELQEFVRAALIQISTAVQDAQESVRNAGGFVNPSMYARANIDSHFGAMESGQHVFLVDFDVAVTASEAIQAGGSAKLSVASVFSAQGGSKSGASSESTSRIKFKVPIALPVDAKTKVDFDRTRDRKNVSVASANPSRV